MVFSGLLAQSLFSVVVPVPFTIPIHLTKLIATPSFVAGHSQPVSASLIFLAALPKAVSRSFGLHEGSQKLPWTKVLKKHLENSQAVKIWIVPAHDGYCIDSTTLRESYKDFRFHRLCMTVIL